MIVKGVPSLVKLELLLSVLLVLVFAISSTRPETVAESKLTLLYKYLVQKNEYKQTKIMREQLDESKMLEWNSKMLQQIESIKELATETSPKNQTATEVENYGWYKAMAGIGYSFLFIFLSEVGVKTFLFIVLYATKMNPVKLLVVSSLGIWTMHILGVLVGDVSQYFITLFWIKLITFISFFIIGVVLIYMGITNEPDNEDIDTKLKGLEEEIDSKEYHLLEDKNDEEARNEIDERDGKQQDEKWYSLKNLGKLLFLMKVWR